MTARNIGITVTPPKKDCKDPDCPFHGNLSVRGMQREGPVVKDGMERTVVIQRDYAFYVPKFRRYERRRSRLHAHNPPCINAKTGDIVNVMECRPLSKTVSFVVIQKQSGKGGKAG